MLSQHAVGEVPLSTFDDSLLSPVDSPIDAFLATAILDAIFTLELDTRVPDSVE